MEATAIPHAKLPEWAQDSSGAMLSVGDRVHVTGSDRFGEDDGTVIGAMCKFDFRLVPDGEVRQVHEHKPVRVRIRLDNGTDGDEYTASAGRVTKID